MIYFLYGMALWLAAPLIVLYHLYRSVSRGRPAAFAERFGFIDDTVLQHIAGEEVIWVHAVSVGETVAVAPLVTEMKRSWPGRKIIISNVTETGREMAGKLAGVDARIYFPFDYRFAVVRLLRLVKPSLIVVVETEIWPIFLRVAKTMGIPVVMVNGRISDRSFGRYLKMRWFFRHVLANFSRFCMQTEEDARRIAAMGANPSLIHVTKNLKFDVASRIPGDKERSALRNEYSIPPDATVITAGSTHAGEEEQLAAAYRRLQETGRKCFMVLVPRHPERAGQVAAVLKREGLRFTLRSQLKNRSEMFEDGEILLVDAVGELTRLYSLSDLVFVGGSLVPTGGHNILEPASLGVPVIFGPHMDNFREIASLVLHWEGGIQVNDCEELRMVLEELLDDPAVRQRIGGGGMRMIEECRGATVRHIAVIGELIGEDREESRVRLR